MTEIKHVYEVRPRKDKRRVDLISDALPFGALWYGEPNAVSNAIGYAKFYQPVTSCCNSRLGCGGQRNRAFELASRGPDGTERGTSVRR